MMIFNNKQQRGWQLLGMVFNNDDDIVLEDKQTNLSIFTKEVSGLWEVKGTGQLAVMNRSK